MSVAQRRATVIGAGLSGLAAALDLLDHGVEVTVLEASPHLGGRCRTYEDPVMGLIDNGTHALAAANPVALSLATRLGVRDRWRLSAGGPLKVVDLEERCVLEVRANPLGFASLGLRPHHVFKVFGRDRPVSGLFAAGSPVYRRLIEPLTIAALNTPGQEASSHLLRRVLREAWRGPSALMPLVAERGLGPDLVEPLGAAIRALGGKVETGTRTKALEREGGRVTALELGARTVAVDHDDLVVLAVPPAEAERLTGLDFGLAHSPIVNAHFDLGTALPGGVRMIGVIGAASQWVLVRGRIASVTVSAADALVDRPANEIADRLWAETSATLGLLGLPAPERPVAHRIVKERRATIRQTPGLRRPPSATAWRNLVLAGDWTDTGLPATIEGALRSGIAAARMALGRGRVAA